MDSIKPSEKPHILVVDDDARIRSLVARFLHENGMVAMTADSADQAQALLKTFDFDILVVDVMMPGQSGLDFTRDIRAVRGLPVILLTALGDTGDRIAGFEAGADDYLPKPFEPRELLLRLQAIMRRAPDKRMNKPGTVRLGRWILDLEQGELTDAGATVRLTQADIAMLRALIKNPGEIRAREDLAAACGLDPQTRAVDVQITRLRRKVEADPRNPRILMTVRNKGYMVRVDTA